MSHSTTVRKLAHPLIDAVRKSVPALPREADPFPMIVADVVDELPITNLPLESEESGGDQREARRSNRLKMIAAFQAGVAVLERRATEINQLVAAVIESQTRPIANNHKEANALRGEKIGTGLAKQKRLKVEVIDVLRAELMGLPDAQVLSTLRQALSGMAETLIRDFQDVLRTLQSDHRAGSIEWFGIDVCKYHYFEHRRGTRHVQGTALRNERVREPGAWVTYQVVSRTLDLEKFDVCTRIEHHLFCATRHQFPAPAVNRPRHLAPLFAAIPSWLAPHVFVVEGDMLRETFQDETRQVSSTRQSSIDVGSHQVGRENDPEEVWTGVNHSPAVTIGSIVIGGWAKADLY